jgi:hypothetical protein
MTRWPGGEAHPDLVAIFQSRRGRIALLLRQTMVPLVEERSKWLDETRRTARAVIIALRAAGLTGPWLVLQWRSLGQVAEVLHGWRCRYDADPVRRAELTRIVERRLADLSYLAAVRARPDFGRSAVEASRPPLDDRGSPVPGDDAGLPADVRSGKEA